MKLTKETCTCEVNPITDLLEECDSCSGREVKETLRAKFYKEKCHENEDDDLEIYENNPEDVADWWLKNTLDPHTVLAYIEKEKKQEIQDKYIEDSDTSIVEFGRMQEVKGFNEALELVATFIRSKIRE